MPPGAIDTRPRWWWFLAGLAAVYVLFQAAALIFGSDRGEAGILIACIVLVALVGVERWLFGVSYRVALVWLGLSKPSARGMAIAVLVSLALVAVVPLVALIVGSSIRMSPGWALMLPALFAQAGIAEETLFRGYLFGHIRRSCSFWNAALLSALPFALVHLALFVVLPWELALASVGLAVVMSPPLAHLFVVGGSTIWPPALLHFVAQGTLKVVDMPTGDSSFAMVWIGACAILPYLGFVWPRRPDG